MTDKSVGSLPLVEVISALREDLKIANENRDPNKPFFIEEIEVELQVVVTKSVEADAKAKIEVLNVGKLLGLGGLDGEVNLKGDWAKASTQKIKLKLTPAERDPKTGKFKKVQINDEADFE